LNAQRVQDLLLCAKHLFIAAKHARNYGPPVPLMPDGAALGAGGYFTLSLTCGMMLTRADF
jgi:hypothetical protein